MELYMRDNVWGNCRSGVVRTFLGVLALVVGFLIYIVLGVSGIELCVMSHPVWGALVLVAWTLYTAAIATMVLRSA